MCSYPVTLKSSQTREVLIDCCRMEGTSVRPTPGYQIQMEKRQRENKRRLGEEKSGKRTETHLALSPFLFLPLSVGPFVPLSRSCIFLSAPHSFTPDAFPTVLPGFFLIHSRFSIMKLFCICNPGFCLN